MEEKSHLMNGEKVSNAYNDYEDTIFGITFKTRLYRDFLAYTVLIHLLIPVGVYYSYQQFIERRFNTLIFSFFLYSYSMLSTTIGAHRLWTHRAFKTNKLVEMILVIGHTITGQASLFKWILRHRVHHKFTDTDADPHNATRGFTYSHIGWFIMQSHPECSKKARTIDMSDILANGPIMFQRRYYMAMLILFGAIIPAAIPVYFWGDSWLESFFVAVLLRGMICIHAVTTINSVTHAFGYKPYDKSILPTENSWASLITYGEGFHNFHHSFPTDYKTSEFGSPLNFSATIIEGLEYMGWAWDLKTVGAETIIKTAQKHGDGSRLS